MAIFNSIMQHGALPFITPPIPGAPSVNPELAKAAQYGGGSNGGGAVPSMPAAGNAQGQGGSAPGGAPGGAPAAGGDPNGIMSMISKLFGGNGEGLQALMSMFGG